MNTVETILGLCKWLEQNVAANIKLKKPDNESQDESYIYKDVTPSVFPLYIPTTDKMDSAAAAISAVPCIAVFPTNIQSSLIRYENSIDIAFSHICWNVGVHSDGIWTKTDRLTYSRPANHSDSQTFSIYEESWFDMLNFVDATRNALLSAGAIGDLSIDSKSPMTQTIETKDISEEYGLWQSTLSARFNLKPVVAKSFRDLL